MIVKTNDKGESLAWPSHCFPLVFIRCGSWTRKKPQHLRQSRSFSSDVKLKGLFIFPSWVFAALSEKKKTCVADISQCRCWLMEDVRKKQMYFHSTKQVHWLGSAPNDPRWVWFPWLPPVLKETCTCVALYKWLGGRVKKLFSHYKQARVVLCLRALTWFRSRTHTGWVSSGCGVPVLTWQSLLRATGRL